MNNLDETGGLGETSYNITKDPLAFGAAISFILLSITLSIIYPKVACYHDARSVSCGLAIITSVAFILVATALFILCLNHHFRYERPNALVPGL